MTTLSLLPPLQITGCAGAAETSSALKFSKFLEGINYDPLSLKALIYFGQGPSVADHPILSIPILQLRKSLVSSATDAYKKKMVCGCSKECKQGTNCPRKRHFPCIPPLDGFLWLYFFLASNFAVSKEPVRQRVG